jgi:prepilin-type N-terminal cleavage/methylation domain-containing protein
MKDTRYKNGLTLIELLVALVVTSIVTAAVATLAYALSSASDATDGTSQKQAQVRFATLKISDLIRHCKLICGTPGGELAVWQADDGDGEININELVYIERGTGNNYLRLCEFPLFDTSMVTLSDIETLSTSGYDVTYVPLIPQCSNVEFYLDDPDSPQHSRLVTISFDVVENGIARQYEISATLRGWAGNLLDGSGNIVSDDD